MRSETTLVQNTHGWETHQRVDKPDLYPPVFDIHNVADATGRGAPGVPPGPGSRDPVAGINLGVVDDDQADDFLPGPGDAVEEVRGVVMIASLDCQQACVKSSEASNGEISNRPCGTGRTCRITSSSSTSST